MTMTPTVAIIIKNSEGSFFVHRRRIDKEICPGLFGLGVGGDIEDGELPIEAAQRELLEETGILARVEFLFNLNYQDDNISHIISVFETTLNQSLLNDKSEWQISIWMSKEAVDRLLLKNLLCPDSAQIYIKYIKEFHEESK